MPHPTRPTTLREAECAASALRDAARAFAVQYPDVAKRLQTRAKRITELTVAEHTRRMDASRSGGRWVSREWGSGPERHPGVGHITVLDPHSQVSDLRHVALCGRSIVGRTCVEFAGHPLDGDPIPYGWERCRPCWQLLCQIDQSLAAPAKAHQVPA